MGYHWLMFTYFTETIVLIFLGYSMVYPLLLFITPSNQIDKGFYRFNLGKCCIIGAIGIIGYHSLSTNLYTEIYLFIWFLMLMSITAIYWNSKQANNFIISIKFYWTAFIEIYNTDYYSKYKPGLCFLNFNT